MNLKFCMLVNIHFQKYNLYKCFWKAMAEDQEFHVVY